MRRHQINDRQERGALRSIAPMGFCALCAPDRFGLYVAIIVGLYIVGAIVTGCAHQFGIGLDEAGQMCSGAHMMRRAAAFGVNARENAKAGGCANRRVGIDVAVENALARQPIDRGRAGQRVAIGTDKGAIILADDPQYVRERAVRRCRRRKAMRGQCRYRAGHDLSPGGACPDHPMPRAAQAVIIRADPLRIRRLGALATATA